MPFSRRAAARVDSVSQKLVVGLKLETTLAWLPNVRRLMLRTCYSTVQQASQPPGVGLQRANNGY